MEEETKRNQGNNDGQVEEERITRKEAFKKVGKYAAYSAAVMTVLFASSDKAHAS